MSGLGIDTRSDIYSLGVLLYELLTGTTPVDKERLLASGFAEMMRIIREEEPPCPSKRISTLGLEATATAQRRRTDEKRLGRELRGEVDWIVMKCLEKDRERRYDTAASVASDVGRYLKNEPVHACPPSATYRIRKFLHRHRGAVAGVFVAVLALCLGLIGTSVGLIRTQSLAKKNAALANREGRAKEQMRRLLYASDMNGLARVRDEGGDDRVEAMLQRHIPQDGHEDLRGFEWYHARSEVAPRWKIKRDGIASAVLSHQSGLLAAYEQGQLSLFDAQTLTMHEQFAIDKNTRCRPDFSPDSERLAYFDGSDIVLRNQTTSEIERLRPPFPVRQIAFAPDGRFVAALGQPRGVVAWKLDEGKEQVVIDQESGGPSATCFALSPDCRSVFCGYKDGSVVVLDMNRELPPHKIMHAPLDIRDVQVSRDGRDLAVATRDELQVFPISTSDYHESTLLLASQSSSPRTGIRRLAFGQDKTIAVGFRDGSIDIWDIRARVRQQSLRGHLYNVNSLNFDANGTTLYSTANDGQLLVWDLRDDARERDSLTEERPITAVAVSPIGDELAIFSHFKACGCGT